MAIEVSFCLVFSFDDSLYYPTNWEKKVANHKEHNIRIFVINKSRASKKSGPFKRTRDFNSSNNYISIHGINVTLLIYLEDYFLIRIRGISKHMIARIQIFMIVVVMIA